MANANPDSAWSFWLNADVRRELCPALARSHDYQAWKTSSAFLKWYAGWYKGRKHPNGRPITPDEVFPEFIFNDAMNVLQRNSLLCLWAKLHSQWIWGYIKSVEWVGGSCEMNFIAWFTPGLKRYLLRLGYGTYMFASALGKWDWGLRSRHQGCQLHFRGMNQPDRKTEVHVDRNNPGDSGDPLLGLYHLIADKSYRYSQDNPTRVRQELGSQGITVPLVP